MTNPYTFTDNPMVSGVSPCNTDTVNDNLMYLKWKLDHGYSSHALKAYEDAGEVIADDEGLADVTNYAHSTFDLSLFTLSGTAKIIDGVLTADTNSGASIPIVYFGSYDSWKIKLKFTTSSSVAATSKGIFRSSYNAWYGGVVMQQSQGKFYVTCGSTTSLSNDICTIDFDITANTTYNIVFEFTGTKYILKHSADGGATWTTETPVSSTTKVSNSMNATVLGNLSGNSYFPGTIDLKYFTIEGNGNVIFSANTVGIDVIKPDNFSVYTDGPDSTTVTNNGKILINPNLSTDKNSIITNLPTLEATDDWKIEAYINSGDLTTIAYFIQPENVNNYSVRAKIQTNTLKVDIGASSSSWFVVNTSTDIPILANTDYLVSIEKLGRDFIIKAYKDGITYVGEKVFTATSDFAGIYTQSYYFSVPCTEGSADINGMKFYKNQELVWQGCLKIPYTESKTGSKVVDSYYRFCLNDMYNQFGYAPYYSLLEGVNFTLPQGELYGMMNKTGGIIDSNFNGSTNSYYIVRSAGDKNIIEQGGEATLTSGEVNWTNPNLTANVNIGGSSFGCTATEEYGSYKIYRIFDGNSSTYWESTGYTPSFTFYNPQAIKVTNLQFTNSSTTAAVPTAGTVLGSNDNTNWTSIKSWTNSTTTANATWNVDLSSNTTAYKYYKVSLTAPNAVKIISELKVTGKQSTTASNDVVFPYSFSDSNYVYNLSFDKGDNSGAYLSAKSATGFTITDSNATKVYWTAKGN